MNKIIKRINIASLVITVILVVIMPMSCKENDDLQEQASKWSAVSVYDYLQQQGCYKNYLRIIDDLGYKNVLQKTGSKTLFVSNDSAFSNLYKQNAWGVTSYEGLSTAQKKAILYPSMLDNALLLEMLSNISAGANDVNKGQALRSYTTSSIQDTIAWVNWYDMPDNNQYWNNYRTETKGGIYMTGSTTAPMMVHFTKEYMDVNNITTGDYKILTGKDYSDGKVFIFKDEVTQSDITCKNGYVQNLNSVLLPPGNMAELIKSNGETTIFSRMLDRFSFPYYDASLTNNYNDVNPTAMHDSIFVKRYFAERSEDNGILNTFMLGGKTVTVPDEELLAFDPGWNTLTSSSTTGVLQDMGCVYVPNDDAMKNYFLPGGEGAFLISSYAQGSENTLANLNSNIDKIPLKIVAAFMNNLFKGSFSSSVPSKFSMVKDDAGDEMDINENYIVDKDGKKDVLIANNGVLYVMNKVIPPVKYNAVSAPALFDDHLSVMNWAVQDKSYLSLNFYAYLLAMSSNFSFMIPTNDAFKFYVDPVSLGWSQPRVLKFTYNSKKTPSVVCSSWKYTPSTGQIGDSIGEVPVSKFITQMADILDYHTVVGDINDGNEYYLTKNGAAIHVSKAGGLAAGEKIYGGQALERGGGSTIAKIHNEKNGHAYVIDSLLQGPTRSVYSIMKSRSIDSEFFNLLQADETCMNWVGISSETTTGGKSEADKYNIFVLNNGLDYNVNLFDSYNYTVYVPDNDAMRAAYALGLPTWDDVRAIYNDYVGDNASEHSEAEEQAAKAKAMAMINEINNFVRYHFQDNSVFVDHTVTSKDYSTSSLNANTGRYLSLSVSGGSDQLRVKDNHGVTITINKNDGVHNTNVMARDFVFNTARATATAISTSSFAVIHEIGKVLDYHPASYGDRYDNAWK